MTQTRPWRLWALAAALFALFPAQAWAPPPPPEGLGIIVVNNSLETMVCHVAGQTPIIRTRIAPAKELNIRVKEAVVVCPTTENAKEGLTLRAGERYAFLRSATGGVRLLRIVPRI
jgi:hypothetical protein